MRISHRHRFIYFSIPKTGSESVRALLDPYSDVAGVPLWETDADHPYYTHMRPVEVRRMFERRGRDFDAYFKFATIRNPWTRLLSLYRMAHGGRNRRLPLAIRDLLWLHPSPRAFRRWLGRTHPDGPGGGGPPDQRWLRYGTYSLPAFVCDEDGEELVDRVLPLERIDDLLPPLLAEIGIEGGDRLRVPKRNVARRPPSTSTRRYYDTRTTELVRARYQHSIRRFGYEPPR